MTRFCKSSWRRDYVHDWSTWWRSAGWSVFLLADVIAIVVLVIWARST